MSMKVLANLEKILVQQMDQLRKKSNDGIRLDKEEIETLAIIAKVVLDIRKAAQKVEGARRPSYPAIADMTDEELISSVTTPVQKDD